MLLFCLIILIIFSGYLILSFVETPSILEKVGLSFLTGLFVETLIMFIMNLVGIELSVFFVFLIPVVSIVVLFRFVRISIYNDSIRIKKYWVSFDLKEYNLLWVFLFGIVIFLLYASLKKSLYWPTFNCDGVHSYAVTGKLIAGEGTFLNKFACSIFHSGLLLTYPLLHTYAFSLPFFLWAFHGENNGFIVLFFFCIGNLQFNVSFY